MLHAQLGVAAENSGKLVTEVRQRARQKAAETHRNKIIIDGPPGIGCAAIASLAGASLALVVTEPTVSGEHDLARVLSLNRHFDVPSAICVNKWDLNPEMAERIEKHAREQGARIAGRIRYDASITRAQMQSLSAVETDAPSGADIRKVWEALDF
jgi:MinD superfamily P-loop ATPase